MLFKNEIRHHNMILQPYCFFGRRIYAQRSKAKENAKAKTCMKNPDALNCAIRHRRCENCPFNKFFRSDKDTTKPTWKSFYSFVMYPSFAPLMYLMRSFPKSSRCASGNILFIWNTIRLISSGNHHGNSISSFGSKLLMSSLTKNRFPVVLRNPHY